MLRLENVHKYFNKGKKNQIHVINNTSLTLKDSGLVALLGNSGCGKTTLLNAIGGLDSIKKGNIYINDQKISSKLSSKADKIRNLNVGYIFQDYKLIDKMTVYDNVALVLSMIGIKDKNEVKTRVEYVLDKVGMLRYKRRPAAMLSGGERQRVGIARALVKNPNIILADEPTGNLDSKNSLEIMKIIKAISKDRLVILVTHEQDLARFYADRIVEISDGQIVKDYENTEVEDLDYVIDNTFYLKDYKKTEVSKTNNYINIYTDDYSEPLSLDIVVKRGNIYIRSNTYDKIEVIDENSSIELVDDHYKKINKTDFDNYEFDFKNIINNKFKPKYSSIFNPISLITNGFKKVFDFSIIKKILLGGFVLSGMFIMYSFSTIFAAISVEDPDFVEYNKNYLTISAENVKVDSFLDIEKREEISYVLPGDSFVNFEIRFPFFYQLHDASQPVGGSISSISMLDDSKLIYGKMPESKYELVVDKLSLINTINDGSDTAEMVGFNDVEDFLNQPLYIPNMPEFKIVGICDENSPSIYTDDSLFINIIANTRVHDFYSSDLDTGKVYDYTLFLNDDLYLKQGRTPVNDYEVIVNLDNKEMYPLNKEIPFKVNDKKLKVVGYYVSKKGLDIYLTNNNTVKYEIITNHKGMTVYSSDKDTTINELIGTYNIKDSYKYSRDSYIADNRENVEGVLLLSGIILLISLIEIFLMIRSSFLSRIKEVGIYRAIGVKKLDIYKMFFGEIFAITTLASMPGLLFMAYALDKLSNIKYLDAMFKINPFIVLVAVITVYVFNLLVGLLPVFNTIRKKPAQILSRQDLD